MADQSKVVAIWRHTDFRLSSPVLSGMWAAFQNSLPVLKIYSLRNVHYRFSVPAVNFGTQPCLCFESNHNATKRVCYTKDLIELIILHNT